MSKIRIHPQQAWFIEFSAHSSDLSFTLTKYPSGNVISLVYFGIMAVIGGLWDTFYTKGKLQQAGLSQKESKAIADFLALMEKSNEFEERSART